MLRDVVTRCLSNLPVALISQKVAVFAGVDHGVEKHTYHAPMSQFAKTAITGFNVSWHNAKAAPLNLPRKHVIFCKQSSLVKSAQSLELGRVKEHKHSGAERHCPTAKLLDDIVCRIKHIVHKSTVQAANIGSNAVHLPGLGSFNRAAQQRCLAQLYISIDEKNVAASAISLRLPCSSIAAYGRQASINDLNA